MTDANTRPDPGQRASAARGAIELAYGLLWLVDVDKAYQAGRAVSLARITLLGQIDRDGQARGIAAARYHLARRSPQNPPHKPADEG